MYKHKRLRHKNEIKCHTAGCNITMKLANIQAHKEVHSRQATGITTLTPGLTVPSAGECKNERPQKRITLKCTQGIYKNLVTTKRCKRAFLQGPARPAQAHTIARFITLDNTQRRTQHKYSLDHRYLNWRRRSPNMAFIQLSGMVCQQYRLSRCQTARRAASTGPSRTLNTSIDWRVWFALNLSRICNAWILLVASHNPTHNFFSRIREKTGTRQNLTSQRHSRIGITSESDRTLPKHWIEFSYHWIWIQKLNWQQDQSVLNWVSCFTSAFPYIFLHRDLV